MEFSHFGRKGEGVLDKKELLTGGNLPHEGEHAWFLSSSNEMRFTTVGNGRLATPVWKKHGEAAYREGFIENW
jgi:hypothetical protein